MKSHSQRSFMELELVYHSISTVRYLLAWQTWLGRDEVTKNGKVIGDKTGCWGWMMAVGR